MSTFSIELPEALTQQIQRKGISQQQIETVLIQVVHLYLRQYQPSETEHGTSPLDNKERRDETLLSNITAQVTNLTDETLPRHTKTLLDVRGSVPASQPQDFDAIRQHVIRTHVQQRVHNGK